MGCCCVSDSRQPISTLSTTGAVGLPVWASFIAFRHVCWISWPRVTDDKIHCELNEMKFTEELSECPIPSVITTFLLLGSDRFCSTKIGGCSLSTTLSPVGSYAFPTRTCRLRTPHSHVRTHHEKTQKFHQNHQHYHFPSNSLFPGFLSEQNSRLLL